jgi:hypothetical protein
LQQLDGPLNSSPLLKDAVKYVLKKGLSAKVYIGIFFLLPLALYYAGGTKHPLFSDWSGIAVSRHLLLILGSSVTIIAGTLVVVGRRFWNCFFHHKGVFEYPPHYTLQ